MKYLFTDKWNFQLQNKDLDYDYIINSDEWYKVELPHDWLIYERIKTTSPIWGWYGKSFIVTPEDLGNITYLIFDGISADATIFINGITAGIFQYGGHRICLDITKFLISGENRIAVKIRHKNHYEHFYGGAGIFRNVWIVYKGKNHIDIDGIYINTQKDKDSYILQINTSCQGKADKIRHTVYDILGEELSVFESSSNHAEYKILKPVTWDIEHPYTYSVKTELISDNKVLDEECTTFAFRTAKYISDGLISLNGRKIKLKGLNLHHNPGCLGSVLNKNALRHQLEILLSAGINAISTIHMPASNELLNLCDEMGILVIDEYSLSSLQKDNPNLDIEPNVKSWITSSNNHPSLIMRFIGDSASDGLKNLIEKYDPYRNSSLITFEHDINNSEDSLFKINEFYGGIFNEYAFDYGAYSMEIPTNKVAIGTRGLPKSCVQGVLQTNGFPNPKYYFIKSKWNESEPVFIKIFPYWDWNKGEIIDVTAYTNAKSAELFFNDESLGIQKISSEKAGNWKVPYETGKLTAKAYDENNNVIAVDTKNSFEDATQIIAELNSAPLYANGKDLKYVTIYTLDKNGNPVENATNRIFVNVKGKTRLVGLDNGDQNDTDSYKSNSKRLHNGKLLALFQTGISMGDSEITFSSKGLSEAKIKITALPCDTPRGISIPRDNLFGEIKEIPNDEIPLRKIELQSSRKVISKENTEINIFIKYLPANATYYNTILKYTNFDGEEQCLNLSESSPTEVKLTDKDIRQHIITVASTNGRDKICLTSTLHLELEVPEDIK